MIDNLLILCTFFFMISMVYSSVGLGGGSMYIAALYFGGYPVLMIPPIALSLNLIVSAIAWHQFKKNNHFRFKLILPFTIFSIPAAFVGGQIKLAQTTITSLLAIFLLFISIRMLFLNREIKPKVNLSWKQSWLIGIPGGSLLGFLAGLVGIGGGIFLAPILLSLGLATSKETAAACSFFVFFNSVSGLISHISRSNLDLATLIPLAATALVGGLIGSYLGAKRISPMGLQRVFGSILLAVSIKLFFEIL